LKIGVMCWLDLSHMQEKNKRAKICYLCGEMIDPKTKDEDKRLSKDHVPPLQFYPEEIRKTAKLNLKTLPAHKKCNNSFREDEEYFMHTYFPTVMKAPIGKLVAKDMKKRFQKPQGQIISKMILKEFDTVTPGNIYLPPGMVIQNIDAPRADRVVRKIVCGLYFLENNKFLPHDTPMNIKFFLYPEDMPEEYGTLCKIGSPKGAYPHVFAYRYIKIPDFHCWSMLLWESFIFCVIFPDLENQAPNAEDD